MTKPYWLAALTLIFSACNSPAGDASTTSPTPRNLSVLKEGKALESSHAKDNSFQLYKLLASNPENVNFSPLSLKIAFSLIYPGTNGETQKLFERLFGFSESAVSPFKAEYELAEKIRSEQVPGVALSIANSVWAKNPKELFSNFKDSLKIQNAEVFKLNLEAMNAWVDNATSHKISKIVNFLSPSTQLVAINAIYFKQKWLSPFKSDKTVVAPFQASLNLSLKVPTMNDKKNIKYYEDETSKWISLPYQNSPLVMILALPIKRFDLNAVSEKLNSEYLINVTAQMKETNVTLSIPKFKFSKSESLKVILSQAGYEDLFTKGDYTKISKSKLSLSDVIQATSIEVDETGTEAAAVTAALMTRNMVMPPTLHKYFLADQPFIFMIQNESTKEIYWLGRVYQPNY